MGDISTLITKGTTPTTIGGDFVSKGINFIKAESITDDGCFIREKFGHIDERTNKLLKRSVISESDILYSIAGVIGRSALVTKEVIPANINQALAIIRLDKNQVDPKYIFYVLSTMKQRNLANSFVAQSVQANINLKQVGNFEIYLPEITEQKRISDILSGFDDKIGLNNKTSRILEQMAQTIFKEWFVDFQFLGYEKAEFVDSEFGRIPKGWGMDNLGRVLETIESGSRPKGGVNIYKEGVPSVGAENIIGLGKYNYSKTKYVPVDFVASMNRGFIKDQDVLLYKDGAEIGRKSFFMEGFPFKKCVINEHVFILRTNERISQIYLYLWLDRYEMTEAIKNLNANSAQPGINQEQIQNGLTILVPENDVIEKFTLLIMPIIRKIFKNALENQKLISLRDLLLPKLMSGEIKV